MFASCVARSACIATTLGTTVIVQKQMALCCWPLKYYAHANTSRVKMSEPHCKKLYNLPTHCDIQTKQIQGATAVTTVLVCTYATGSLCDEIALVS